MDACATANMVVLDFGKAFDFVNQYMQGPLSFFYHRYSSVFLVFYGLLSVRRKAVGEMSTR